MAINTCKEWRLLYLETIQQILPKRCLKNIRPIYLFKFNLSKLERALNASTYGKLASAGHPDFKNTQKDNVTSMEFSIIEKEHKKV